MVFTIWAHRHQYKKKGRVKQEPLGLNYHIALQGPISLQIGLDLKVAMSSSIISGFD
jgi:hypothetical protein